MELIRKDFFPGMSPPWSPGTPPCRHSELPLNITFNVILHKITFFLPVFWGAGGKGDSDQGSDSGDRGTPPFTFPPSSEGIPSDSPRPFRIRVSPEDGSAEWPLPPRKRALTFWELMKCETNRKKFKAGFSWGCLNWLVYKLDDVASMLQYNLEIWSLEYLKLIEKVQIKLSKAIFIGPT